MNKRKSLLKSELERFLKILKKHYSPQMILLFGSLASNKIKNWSDVDLIIVKDTDKPFFERLKEMYNLLKPKVGIDILIYTPDEYKKMKNRLFFKKEILNKGRILYEKR